MCTRGSGRHVVDGHAVCADLWVNAIPSTIRAAADIVARHGDANFAHIAGLVCLPLGAPIGIAIRSSVQPAVRYSIAGPHANNGAAATIRRVAHFLLDGGGHARRTATPRSTSSSRAAVVLLADGADAARTAIASDAGTSASTRRRSR